MSEATLDECKKLRHMILSFYEDHATALAEKDAVARENE